KKRFKAAYYIGIFRKTRYSRTSKKTHPGYPMSNKGQLLQDPFLNTLRKEHVPVSIYLVNGIKLQGQIEPFDQYVVLLKNTVTQWAYKPAPSPVFPWRGVNLAVEHSAAESGAPPLSFFPRPDSMIERTSGAEDAVLVGLDLGQRGYSEGLEELGQLAASAGIRARAVVRGRRDRPDPAHFAGSGKVEEIKRVVKEHGASLA